MNLIRLEERHIIEAATLFIEGYKGMRKEIPYLPEQHESLEEVSGLIFEYIQENEAIAVVEEEHVIGYMLGYECGEFFNSFRSIYVPVWGHASTEINKKEIYHMLYANRSEAWVERGYLTHCLTLFSNNRASQELFSWLGFGMRVVDAVREIKTVNGAHDDRFVIRLATISDVREVSKIAIEHQNYMTQAPIFMPLFEEEDEAYYLGFVEHSEKKVWIALEKDKIIAYMQIEKSTQGTTHVISDPNAIAITGAYTRQEYRSRGIAKTLLGALMLWAKENNKTFCSVDFETFNVNGSRFWLKYFEPVCYSMVRVIDDRILK